MSKAKTTAVVAPAALIVRTGPSPRDVWGLRLGTRGAIVNAILLAAKGPLTTAEIEQLARATAEGLAYEKLHNTPLGGVYQHLRWAQARGFVTHDGRAWHVTGAKWAVGAAPGAAKAARAEGRLIGPGHGVAVEPAAKPAGKGKARKAK
jgi:hypothetical protein